MIEARFRHRAGSETVQEFHEKLLPCLQTISRIWKSPQVDGELETNGESAAFDLTPYLCDGMQGAISYAARYPSGMVDRAMFDDVLTLQIDENVVDYATFVNKVFEQAACCFHAYRGAIVHDLDLDLDDYDEIIEQTQRSGKDIDGRDSVFRINPVNYFDSELCKRAFRRSVDEIASCLCGEVERVVGHHDGLLLVVTSDLVNRENLKAIHDHVASLLDLESDVPS